MSRTPCPSPELLERLLLGQLSNSRADEFEHHLATCAMCVAALADLSVEDEFSQALRPPLWQGHVETSSRIEALLPTLKQLRHKGSSVGIDHNSTQNLAVSISPEATIAAAPHIGTLGGYHLVKELGAGGMGVVYLAEDPDLKRQVALKVVRPALVASKSSKARFMREAQALAALEHDHIVTVFRVGEEDGTAFLAMQLLKGRSLEDHLNEVRTFLSTSEILRIGREIATGLAVAHTRNMVHRDIKPANIWLESGTDRVKILDFGLVQALSDGSNLDRPGVVLGTPAYMAPEQASGQTVDPRADLFSLGCVMYCMATGQTPFNGSTVQSILTAVMLETPTAPRQLNQVLPEIVEAFILRLMAKNPEERPFSAEEVISEIAAIEEQLRPKMAVKFSKIKPILAGVSITIVAAILSINLMTKQTVFYEPPTPGEVDFDYDEADARIILRRDDEEQTADLASERRISLSPGEYTIRPATSIEGRSLFPSKIIVEAGIKQNLALSLIGPIVGHREHSPLGASAVAVVERDGKPLILSVGQDRTLVFWEPFTRTDPKAVWHRDSPLRCLALRPDHLVLATGSGDTGPRAIQVIRFWNIGSRDRRAGELRCSSQLNSIAYSPDASLLASGENDGTLCIWDIAKSLCLAGPDRFHDGKIYAIAFLSSKRILTAGGDGKIVERNVADLEAVQTLTGHEKAVRALVVLPGAKEAASAGDDGTIHIWNLAEGSSRKWQAPAAVHSLAISPDGKRLMSGDSAGVLRLWEIATGKEIVHFDGNSKAITSVAYLPGGRRAVSAGADGAVRLWELPR